MEKADILKAAENAYYVNSGMIKFLLVENLALKTLLNEKGLITPDEYKKYQEFAARILSMKEEQQMLAFFQKMLNRHPSEANAAEEVHKD